MANSDKKLPTFVYLVDSTDVEITDPNTIDWDNLGFDIYHTATIGGSVAKAGGAYESFTLVPYGRLKMPVGSTTLNYGQTVFEGLKAIRGIDGQVRIFRVEANAKRMRDGAGRFLMEPVPEDLFVKGVLVMVKDNVRYVPPHGKGSLYIRPILYASGAALPPKPSSEYVFLVFVTPVGHYFKGLSCISILVTTDFQRAAERGAGHVKASGNYAPSFQPIQLAKAKGFAETLFLDHSRTYVEEVGSANISMIKEGRLIVADSPAILPGITRSSIAAIAEKTFDMEVSFERLKIDRILGINEYERDGAADELFCTGTSAVVSPIGRIDYQDTTYTFNDNEVGPITRKLHDALVAIQTGAADDTFGWTTVV
ncbi:MAG: branched-chain amino acid aminotransferase [Proteobacteria bacterium]|nr:branched-chain amino acid aminotransferase [Pseudomonadota bacterium]